MTATESPIKIFLPHPNLNDELVEAITALGERTIDRDQAAGLWYYQAAGEPEPPRPEDRVAVMNWMLRRLATLLAQSMAEAKNGRLERSLTKQVQMAGILGIGLPD